MTTKYPSVSIFPLLIAAVWLASATATSTSRESKQWSPNRYTTVLPLYYRFQPLQYRYGLEPRNSNSPIYPMIGQQGIGPFLGDFPNQLFRQSCPDCATPPAETITTCGGGIDASLSAAPSGTISVNIKQFDKAGKRKDFNCHYGFVAYYPNSKVQLKCTSLGSGTTLGVYNIVSPVTEGAVDTVYTSKGSFLLVVLKAESELQAECTWETVLG